LSLCKSRNCVVPIVEFSLSTANDFAFEELQLVEELEDDFVFSGSQLSNLEVPQLTLLLITKRARSAIINIK